MKNTVLLIVFVQAKIIDIQSVCASGREGCPFFNLSLLIRHDSMSSFIKIYSHKSRGSSPFNLDFFPDFQFQSDIKDILISEISFLEFKGYSSTHCKAQLLVYYLMYGTLLSVKTIRKANNTVNPTYILRNNFRSKNFLKCIYPEKYFCQCCQHPRYYNKTLD